MVEDEAVVDAVLLGDGEDVREIVGDFVAASHSFHDATMHATRIRRNRGADMLETGRKSDVREIMKPTS